MALRKEIRSSFSQDTGKGNINLLIFCSLGTLPFKHLCCKGLLALPAWLTQGKEQKRLLNPQVPARGTELAGVAMAVLQAPWG